MGHLRETLISAFRRMRIRMGDAGWAAVQPARSKLHAGSRRFTRWRRRRTDALCYAGASLRMSWQGATGRRRATVGVLAVLPIAMASGVTAMVLPAGGDPRAGPAQERMAADAPSRQHDLKPAPATPRSRAERPKPARGATRAAGAGSASQGIAVTPGPAVWSDGSSPGGGRQGGDSRGRGGSDSPADERAGTRGVERRTSAAPAPPPRTPSRRVPAGGDGKRPAPSPDPPAAKPHAPKAQAPAPAPVPTAPPVAEPAPQVTEPDAEVEEDSDGDEGDQPGNSERRGPPADPGGNDDTDGKVDP